MTGHATLPLIPTAVVGSHGKPGWWFASLKAIEHGDFGPADLEEMFDDAANTAIRDMETAGVDIITDGEVRRLDGYVDSYYAIIKGIEPLPIRRKAGPWGYDQRRATRQSAASRRRPAVSGSSRSSRTSRRARRDTPRRPARARSRSARGSIRASSTKVSSTSPSASPKSSTQSSADS